MNVTSAAFEAALEGDARDRPYVLCLFVVGPSPLSQKAIECLDQICREQIEGEYELNVVDLRRHPAAAAEYNLIAAPTLIRFSPPPVRRVVGDLSNADRVMSGLMLHRRAPDEGEKQ